ncbi:MAG TPA: acyl-CoA thioesterase domain-containing protein [Nocardioides sp.]|nr:acyl-CoA thioesterase domain-containing protein [Nocardioides sp.]
MAIPPTSDVDGLEGPPAILFADLIPLLDIADRGEDRFEAGHSELARVTGHVFGGLLAAQALVAAGRTVDPARTVHSLHAYFLRPGDATLPLHLEVTRSRDGRSFSHRRVDAVQDGKTILELSCSFALPREGLAHQRAAPAAPQPEGLRNDHDVLRELLPGAPRPGMSPEAFDLRTAGLDHAWLTEPSPVTETTQVWMRAGGPVPADPLLRAALLVFASDLRSLHPVLRPHGRSLYDDDVHPATIDHAVWIHRVPPVDEWLLWCWDSPWADQGRGFVRATTYDRHGHLVAEATQEGLIRIG